MPLIYALTSRGSIILAEHAATTGNFQQVTQHILERLPEQEEGKDGETRMTFVYDRYLFHHLTSHGITFLCLADDGFGRRIPFAFLEDLKQRFEKTYGFERPKHAIAYGLNEFSRVIQAQMEHFNNTPQTDRFHNVQSEIDAVRDVMVTNIEKVLERGDRIEILVDKTDTLNATSFAFKKRSTALRRREWWKNTKLMVLMGVGVLLVIWFVVTARCGFTFSDCKA
ncbi:putative vesicle-associated membrane protein [Fimicolochytrium jonesii]|uniref:putative vesicle-associated membrane protein n=1 Tax=Fimicolochytrium jonesii TaxID=1396493 RepID=UPI0022FF0940|nr:putative vesicle-associated membrane protein [Fimicolochytrium jonesii]KAI8819946.1 putative vesicle-associated membrane protein [Fimicolochytrium jonesii]